jgi:CRISPR-associated protein Csy3
MAKKKNTKNATTTTAPVKELNNFSLERSLFVSSAGKLSAVKWENRHGIQADVLIDKKQGGANACKTHFMKDEATILKEARENNTQQDLDMCHLPVGFDTLCLEFSVEVQPFNKKRISACNLTSVRKRLTFLITEYVTKWKFKDIAVPYVNNVVNGCSLWRNQNSADEIITEIEISNGKQFVFNSFDYDQNKFTTDDPQINEIADMVADTLCGKQRLFKMTVRVYARLGDGHVVYPSQNLTLDTKGKFLYELNSDHLAGMHDTKIGAALRRIDTWYPDYIDNNEEPIPVYAYGQDRTEDVVHRYSSDSNIYGYIKTWLLDEQDIPDEAKHFVMSCFVFGGVFTPKNTNNNKNDANNDNTDANGDKTETNDSEVKAEETVKTNVNDNKTEANVDVDAIFDTVLGSEE